MRYTHCGRSRHSTSFQSVMPCFFHLAQKSQIITKLTDAMVSIEDENMRPVTWVVMGHWRAGSDHRRCARSGCKEEVLSECNTRLGRGRSM